MATDRILKDRAITLRVTPFSQTSQMVTWLTEHHGRVTTSIKGARRPKSAFLGQYDLFYLCDLLFYSKDRGGVHIARECMPVETRQGLRGNWKAVLCASYLCDLTSTLFPPGAPAPAMFAFLNRCLVFLEEETPGRCFIPWFEFQAACLAGFAPALDSCTLCGNSLKAGEKKGPQGFSPASGGIVCADCARERNILPAPAERRTLEILQSWQSPIGPECTAGGKVGDRQADELCALTGAFLEYHLHPLLAGRKIALVLL